MNPITNNSKTMTPRNALILLIQALAIEPNKVATTGSATAITITSWKKDHARIVGWRGETIYSIKKIAEHLGISITLTEPEPDIHATAPDTFSPRDILSALHTGARETTASIEGDTVLTVRNHQLSPDFTRAIWLVFYKAGKARDQHWEVNYQ